MSYRKCILIPMRGGSKGILRKNLVDFNGKPLCHHILETAKKTGIDVWVSTEDEEIKKEAISFNVGVIDRPIEFAQDFSLDFDVFLHFIESAAIKYDYIVHLRATFPRIKLSTINEAIQSFESLYEYCSSMRSVVIATEIPWKMWVYSDDGYHIKPITNDYNATSMPRQLLKPVFYQNAAIDIIKVKTILEENSMVGSNPVPFLMKSEDGNDIDNIEDLRK